MPALVRKIYNNIFSYETRLWLYKIRHPQEYHQLRAAVNPSIKGDFSLKPFDEHQCIFIHITKTAGTSVAKSLFNYLPYHYTAIDYRVIYGKKTFNQYYKFAYVRNPWDRLYSAFRYLKAGGWNEKDKKWAESNLEKFDDFNDFVKQWLCENNIQKHVHFKPQHHFICDRKGKLLINYLAYFETLKEDFDKISSRLKIDANIGYHNANPGRSYRDEYDSESKRIVANVYARDIKLFGYEFGGIKDRNKIK